VDTLDVKSSSRWVSIFCKTKNSQVSLNTDTVESRILDMLMKFHFWAPLCLAYFRLLKLGIANYCWKCNKCKRKIKDESYIALQNVIFRGLQYARRKSSFFAWQTHLLKIERKNEIFERLNFFLLELVKDINKFDGVSVNFTNIELIVHFTNIGRSRCFFMFCRRGRNFKVYRTARQKTDD